MTFDNQSGDNNSIERESAELLQHLLGSLRDGNLTSEQIAQLDLLLADDPQAREEYLNYVQLYADLRDHHGVAPSLPVTLPAQTDLGEETTAFVRSFRRWGMLVGMVSAIMLVLAFYLFQEPSTITLSSPLQIKGTVAVLTRVANATWANETPLVRGSKLPAGHLKLKSGLVQIEFFHGAVVILEGPADFELIDSQRAYLHHGQLRSYVPMPSRGFVIETPQRKLIDHGTEFGLSVNATGLTEVHVFEGKVEMQGQDSEYLTAGESKQFSNADFSKSIPFNQPAFSGPATLAEGANQQLVRQHATWKRHASTLAKDPAALVYYLFDKHDEWGRSLKDISTTPHHGAIVGSQWTKGRWHQKEALEFKRTTDRVRISVPDDFQSLTFMAWVRIEGFDQWLSAIMLTDGFQQGEVHWQLSDQGELILGVNDKGQAVNYFSPQILSADDLGRWVHLATVYDHNKKQVTHYLDGKQVSQQAIRTPITLRIGTAEIGNWNSGDSQSRSIRSLNGLIDEFALFSRPFDANEIKKHYTIGKPN